LVSRLAAQAGRKEIKAPSVGPASKVKIMNVNYGDAQNTAYDFPGDNILFMAGGASIENAFTCLELEFDY
jgi:hypothetical protein